MSAADGPWRSSVRVPRLTRSARWAISPESRRRLAWLTAGIIMAAVSWSAIVAEVAAARHPVAVLAGEDFWNNTWWAVRTLLAGADIYGPTHAVVPGIELAWPVAPHVPASLLWQAPFAALPVPTALYAFTLASIAAIWAGIFVLARPTGPLAILGCAACGAFATMIGGGPETLLLGQPTGFILLGLAIVVRAKRPWLAAIGFLFAATTLQVGLPLALALLVLRGWPVLWRGLTLTVACSMPAIGIGIASNGFHRFISSFVQGALIHLGRQSNRIDLGAMLQALGVSSVELRVAAGLAAAALCLAYLAKLPQQARRIDNPQVFCLVISLTLLCAYHQYYDVLLVGAGVIPVILIVDRSWSMLPSFGCAAAGAAAAVYGIRDIAVPLCLVGVAAGSVWALRTSPALAHRRQLALDRHHVPEAAVEV